MVSSYGVQILRVNNYGNYCGLPFPMTSFAGSIPLSPYKPEK